MAHKIVQALPDQDAYCNAAGMPEVAESFFGPSESGKLVRGAERKSVVTATVSAWVNLSGKEDLGFGHGCLAGDTSTDSIERVLKRLPVPASEVKPLITGLRSDGWKGRQTVTKKLGVVHYRAITSDHKDSMKLLLDASPHSQRYGRCVWPSSGGVRQALTAAPFRSMLPLQPLVPAA